jgi:multidrug efflux pump subunit AcrA (membrane-fusion protein)
MNKLHRKPFPLLLSVLPWLSVFFLLSVLFLLSACALQEPVAPELIPPVSERLDITKADTGSVADIIRKPGIVRLRSRGLSFKRTPGIFGAFYVKHGEAVQEGQLLATLDTKALEEEIIKMEENLTRLKEENTLRREIRRLEIDEMIFNYNLKQNADDLNEADFHFIETLYMAIETALLTLTHEEERHSLAEQQAAGRLENHRLRLSGTRLYAPFNGIITHIQPIVKGDAVSVSTPVIYIAQPSSLHIEVYDFTFRDFPDPPGMSPVPWIPIPVIQAVRIRAYSPHGDFDLTYMGLPPAERTGHGMPPVYMEIAGPPFPPLGAMVGVHLYLAWVEETLRIPSNALFHEPGTGFFAYRVINSRLVQTPLEIGVRGESFSEVLDGLAEGDEVFVRP